VRVLGVSQRIDPRRVDGPSNFLRRVANFVRVGSGGKGPPRRELIFSIAAESESESSRIAGTGCLIQQCDQLRFRFQVSRARCAAQKWQCRSATRRPVGGVGVGVALGVG